MLKQFFLATIFAISSINCGSALQSKVKELEKRIEKLEKQLSGQAKPKMRKATCPETCNCGPDCGCADCKCGIK